MSDFLSSALTQARADLNLKRGPGSSTGKTSAADQPVKKKAKWLGDKNAYSGTKSGAKKSDNSVLSDYDLERSRKALERKEKQYKKMFNRGTDMHLEGEAADNLLIDFDRKWAEGHRQEDSDKEDDANLTADDPEDPLIEVEDEFGRLRKIRKSEALRHEKPEISNPRPANLIYGRHLQTFNPDAQKKDEIWAEEEASREVHYDPKFEVRQRGAGYIHLGRGQDRRDRMGQLNQTRNETVSTRLDHGLTDPEPPPLVTVPADTEDTANEEHRHPSRRQHLPAKPRASDNEARRRRERLEAGEAFLNSIT